MSRLSIALLGVLVASATSGCSGPYPSSSAALSAPPPIPMPVGPVPGPWPQGQNPAPQVQNPFAHSAAAVVQGRQLFVHYNCAGCHGGHGGGGMGPSLRDRAWLFGSSPAEVFDSIAEGRGHGMPAWGARLPTEQIWKIVAYVKSMRTSREPDPPSPAPPSAPLDAAAQIQ